MKIFKSSIWSVSSVGIRVIVVFIINKLFALNFGPQGITLLSHFQNLLSIFLTVPNDGINKGVIKYTADSELDKESYYPILNAGLILNFIVFSISLIGLFLLKSFFDNPFVGTNNIWLGIVIILALFQLLNLLGLSLILAKENVKVFVILQVMGNLISLVLVWLMIEFASFHEALLAWAAGPALTFFVTIGFLIKKQNVALKQVLIIPSGTYLKKLGQFILMALSIVLFSKSVDFIIRQYAISNFSSMDTGLWQSVVRVSDLYLMAFVAILSMVYYPRVSTIINQEKELKDFVRSFLKKTALLSLLFLVTLFFLKNFILRLFFNEDFVQAAWLFPYQLIGDYFKVLSWVLSFLILAQSRTTLFVSSQFVFALIFMSLTYYFSELLSIEGFPIAYAIKNAIYLLFVLWVYRKLIFFE